MAVWQASTSWTLGRSIDCWLGLATARHGHEWTQPVLRTPFLMLGWPSTWASHKKLPSSVSGDIGTSTACPPRCNNVQHQRKVERMLGPSGLACSCVQLPESVSASPRYISEARRLYSWPCQVVLEWTDDFISWTERMAAEETATNQAGWSASNAQQCGEVRRSRPGVHRFHRPLRLSQR